MGKFSQVYYCASCEALVDITKEQRCTFCDTQTSRMYKTLAMERIAEENLSRLAAWTDAGRVLPEVEV